MDADELADKILADDSSSVSSLDVSEEENNMTESNSKKRKRTEIDQLAQEDDLEEDRIMYVIRIGDLGLIILPQGVFLAEFGIAATCFVY